MKPSSCYRRAISAGDVDAPNGLAKLLVEQGQVGEPEQLYRRAIDAGDIDALWGLAALLEKQGQLGPAEGSTAVPSTPATPTRSAT